MEVVFTYLGVHLSNDLTCSINSSSLTWKIHQCLYFLRWLRQVGLRIPVLACFYWFSLERILCSCITVWHSSFSVMEKSLHRMLKAAQKIVGVTLLNIENIYMATCILKDSTHPAHTILTPLPSGRMLQSIRSKTSRLRNSFYPEVVRLLNSSVV